jgi:hypothetical protein
LLPELLFNVLEFANPSLRPEDIHVLLNAYIATLFLPGIIQGKLLLEILGDTSSGKTLFLRLLGRLIYGRYFQVTGMDTKAEQVENAIVNNSFLVFDDVKRTSDPAILGMIRRACTGGSCNRRELYSTFKQVTEPYRAAIALSCSEEPFTGTDEMSNRALVILAKQREDFLGEEELLARIDENRNALMAEMMVRIQNVIVAVKAQRNFKPRVKLRMASFATFLLRVGRQWDWGAGAQHILDAWHEEQEGAGLDPEITETLDAWLTEKDWKSERLSADQLCQQMGRAAMRNNLGSPWWVGKPAALVRALRRSSRAYGRHYGFGFAERTSGHTAPRYWFDPNKDQFEEIRLRRPGQGVGAAPVQGEF